MPCARRVRETSLPRAVRGFTLTELMVVVALVGILAMLGIASFRKEVAASKTTEASAVIQAIRAAQEGYRSEHQSYLDVSSSADRWYPVATFGETRYDWNVSSHTDLAAWRALNPVVTQPVMFRYLVRAGAPGVAMPTLGMPNPPSWDLPTDPWFVIRARADADGDGTYCDALASSLNGEVYVRNEGE